VSRTGKRIDSGRAVSRVLSAPRNGGENHLSQQPVPGTWKPKLPGSGQLQVFPIWPCTGRGFPCLRAYARSGGLLPHLFTLIPHGGTVCFLWHYPSGRLATSPPVYISGEPGVTRHPALWCSDFPPPSYEGSDSPLFQNRRKHSSEAVKTKGQSALNSWRYPLNRQQPGPCRECSK
jgi:hypothetical protein